MYYGPNTGVPSPLNGPIAPGSPARVSSPGNSMASLPPMGYSVAHNASPLYSNTISRYPVQMNLSQKLQQPSQMVNMQQPMGMGPGSTSYNGLSATLLGMSNSGANNPGLNNAVGNGGPLMNGMGQVYNTNLSPTMHPLGTGPTALPPVASVPLSTSHQHLIAMHQKSRQTMTPHFHASTAFSASRSSMYSQPESTSTTCASATAGEGRTSTDDASPTISSTKAGNSAVTASGTTSASDSTGTATVESTWTGIDLGGMGLHSVSTTLFRYSFLTKVYLNHNRLTYLPSSVRDLVNLEELDVSGNQLSTLPPELGMVTTLKKLLAFDNLIQSIPYELGTLFRLNVLGLEGNPLQDPLKTLLQKEGTQELIHYLRDNASPVAPPEPRPWVTLDKEAAQKGHEIVTVMSYNILSSRYATPQQYGYVPSWALDWDHRRDIILKEILERDADIVCLQELETSEFYDVFEERLKEDGGYTGAFWPKSRARTMTDQERKWVDGCVIFYKESKFNLRESHVFEFQQSAMQQEDFKKSAVAFDRFFTKDNIAAFMVLEHKVKGTPLLVANCHIHWNPEYTDVKVVQVAMLMEEIERLTARYGSSTSKSSGTMRTSGKASTMGKSNGDGTPYLSTILCGDFNSTPDSGVVEYITRGTLPKDHADLIKCTYSKFATKGFLHSLSLKSAYGAVGELPLTNFSPSFRDVIDYIYYSDGTLTPTGLLGAVDPDYLDRVVGFPTPDIPSDHICLMSQFKWKSSPSTTTSTTTRSVSSGASSTAFGTTRMGGVGSSFTFNRPHSESSAPGSPSSQFRKTTSSLGKK